ncbi:MAG: ATP-binding protein [Bacilli bacterium]|nr:ATP-binding protein [Bacilli bacterium]
MLRRKIYDQLLSWKAKKHEKGMKECLLIKGARQVGKSYIVEQFGKENYESFVNINFITHPELKKAFEGNKSPERIYSNLSILLPDIKLIPGKTLIFLDEIQNCGDARTAIKFLASDPRYDFIASGSLLGLEYGEDGDEGVEVPESIPVGYESEIIMYPLDFEEYLWAKGYEGKHIDQLREYFDKKEKVPDFINEKMESLFREYIVVGGMPEVVAAFVKSGDFNEAFSIQDKILSDYRNDISKHAKGEEKLKVNACYESIPKQLSKELKRFQYSLVEKKKTSRKYGGSVKWLKDSSLVNACYNISKPEIPLLAYEKEDQFKLYLNDTGLLTELYGRETKVAVFNNTIKGNGKGAIYENVISQILTSKGYKLHYYRPDDNRELEFVIEKGGEVLPIEVKAGNTASTTLNNFINDFKPSVAYKIIKGNIGLSDNKFTMPHYMAMFL